jgi:imidazolonepropionase-like amidohydrolase
MTRTVFTGGQVFDGTRFGTADVVVEAGRVLDVGTGLDGDAGVDCSGATVLPGLIDCHVHVMVSGVDMLRALQTPFSYAFYEAARNLRATLAAGITTVRDAGGADLGVKRAVEHGLVAGPRMQISISILSQTGGHGDDWMPSGIEVPLMVPHPGRPAAVVDGHDEVRRAARTILRAGADVLKVCTTGGVLSPADDPRHSQFTAGEVHVIVVEAAAQGRPVMAHAQGADGIKLAVRAGVRSIEHGIYLDAEAVDLMVEHDTWLVPTLVAPRAVVAAARAGAAIPEPMVAKAIAVSEVHAESFARAVEGGVRIAMGTDSGVGAHGTNLDELPLMAACGMAPEDVLAAATSRAAELLGVADELGSLAPGMRADLVVVDGDARDLHGLRPRIREVWQEGVRVVARD